MVGLPEKGGPRRVVPGTTYPIKLFGTRTFHRRSPYSSGGRGDQNAWVWLGNESAVKVLTSGGQVTESGQNSA